MVCSASNNNDGTTEGITRTTKVSVHLFSDVGVCKERKSSFCREDDMNNDSGEGLGHVSISPFQGCLVVRVLILSEGVALG